MPEQISLRFDREPNYARKDFVLGSCNAMAADWIDRWPDWPGRIKGLVIHGLPDSGKSHLGAIWAEISGASMATRLNDQTLQTLADNPHILLDHPASGDDLPEEIFFHLLNRLIELDGTVLILSRQPVSAQSWGLADLSSRLAGLMSAEIGVPDDTVLMAVMQKIADDLGLALSPEILSYTIARMERSFTAARQTVEMIDSIALARKKKASLAMVREIMDSMEPRLL